jgi:hypothetical protein
MSFDDDQTESVTSSRRSTSASHNVNKRKSCPDHHPTKARRIKIAVSQSESDDTEESCQEEEEEEEERIQFIERV